MQRDGRNNYPVNEVMHLLFLEHFPIHPGKRFHRQKCDPSVFLSTLFFQSYSEKNNFSFTKFLFLFLFDAGQSLQCFPRYPVPSYSFCLKLLLQSFYSVTCFLTCGCSMVSIALLLSVSNKIVLKLPSQYLSKLFY